MRTVPLLFLLVLVQFGGGLATAAPRVDFHDGDIVAFLGGGDVAAMQFSGHLESLFAVQAAAKVKFRNFGWEGDTVFEQPRDFGFPGLIERVQKVNPTVLIVQYGRTEALEGNRPLSEFRRAYAELVRKSGGTARVILVTPPPFERPEEPLPNLALRNAALSEYAKAIREMAQENDWALLDLFDALGAGKNGGLNLSADGLQLTPRGHAIIAQTLANLCGFTDVAKIAGDAGRQGEWSNQDFERLRQAIIAKNRLWFDYSRPQNWAFLGGDRVTQPSSRDHRDPNKRWFPEEMEKFPALITRKEEEIWKLTEVLR